jgi:hypothetical protein
MGNEDNTGGRRESGEKMTVQEGGGTKEGREQKEERK